MKFNIFWRLELQLKYPKKEKKKVAINCKITIYKSEFGKKKQTQQTKTIWRKYQNAAGKIQATDHVEV